MNQTCPICATEVPSEPRYPNKLCDRCSALARDEQGRHPGVWRPRDDGKCWVNGRACIAGEHRFGGIVVQALTKSG
jgi:hypothetical protein